MDETATRIVVRPIASPLTIALLVPALTGAAAKTAGQPGHDRHHEAGVRKQL